jgi:PKD repeat protein
MAIVLLVAVATAGPVTYIVTGDDAGNSYYLKSMGDGTLELQTLNGDLNTEFNWGTGIGTLTNKENYDFVVGTGSTGGPEKKIYLYEGTSGNGNPFPNAKIIGEWSLGDYPADMPVANFHGKVFDVDTLDDFMMVQYPSQDVGLYMNKGNGVFEQKELLGTAPPSPVGADAADINHDGIADFVVAPTAPWEQGEPPYSYYIHVNLGLGNNEFTKSEIETRVNTPYYGGTPYWGITAADFDGDNKVDLIATIADENGDASGFDFYMGNGEGVFTWEDRFGVDLLLSTRSPVDNYDLDGDGDQDLVAANPFDVIVGRNEHYGQFIDGEQGKFTFTTYSVPAAGTGLKSIAAPPVFPNEAPVADFSVTPALPEDNNRIAAGTTLAFSGAGSEDPEGMPLEYSWKFGDDDTLLLTQDASHQFITPGIWDVTLTVTDNYGETATKKVTIDVNHPPVANDDWYDTVFKTPLTISATLGVLASDTDADGDPFTAVMVDGPDYGTLTLNTDGSFTYDPYDDFTGPEDSFTYKVNDVLNDSNVATVTLNFNAPMTWKVNIVPGMINLKSKGVFIAFITLPQTYNANTVQKETVVCEGAPAIRLIRHAKFPQAFGAIFRTADLNKDVKVGKKVEFTVTGKVESDGQLLDFSGSDKVQVSNHKTKIKDETEKFENQGDKKLFDDYFKGHKAHKDNNDNNDNNDNI